MTDLYTIRTDVEAETTITMDCVDLPLYNRLVYGHQAEAEVAIEFDAAPPAGPGPRFVLWGGRERDVQIGSSADTIWRWRRLGTMRFTMPRVRLQ